jgi:aminocarboxymuconate-semialdehyde decarboxylase
VIFVHQQGGNTLVTPRTKRYHPFNTIGNLADRTVTFASLVFGGVMDRCPDLKICLAQLPRSPRTKGPTGAIGAL